MTEHDIYQRAGAFATLIGVVVGMSKLGIFRAFMAWWRRPSERMIAADISAKLARAIDGLSSQFVELRHVFTTGFKSVSDAVIVAGASARMALDISHVAMWECNAAGECIWVNAACADMFGMPREKMLGRGWTTAIAPGHGVRAWRSFQDAINGGVPYRENYPIIVDHKIINVTSRGDVLADSEGKILRIFGTVEPTETMAA